MQAVNMAINSASVAHPLREKTQHLICPLVGACPTHRLINRLAIKKKGCIHLEGTPLIPLTRKCRSPTHI